MLLDNWKGIKLDVRTGNPKPMELYNLAVDPSETTDLAFEHPEIVARIDSLMGASHVSLQGMSLFTEDVEGDMPF